MTNIIERMINDIDMVCTVCDTPQSIGCRCWTKCQQLGCKWSYRTGEKCRNPEHISDQNSPADVKRLSKCPKCGGPADNGHDREDPPNPYFCTRCAQQPITKET